jgi:hypothetical protein
MRIKIIGKSPRGPTVLKPRGRIVGAIVKVGRYHYKFAM